MSGISNYSIYKALKASLATVSTFNPRQWVRSARILTGSPERRRADAATANREMLFNQAARLANIGHWV